MEATWYVDRKQLYGLRNQHPEWTKAQLAEAVGRSMSWVKKWLKRFREALAVTDDCFWGNTRVPHTAPEPYLQKVVDRILELRDEPPIPRQLGPRAILYYLASDPNLAGERVPRSTRTVWKILDQHQRIYRAPKREHHFVERPEPLTAWQLDFKDVTTVQPDPDGKQQHVVEVMNVVDVGTSIVLDASPREDFNAATAIWAATSCLLKHGLPAQVTYDRDPRFVGSYSGRDFPSAFTRFWLCLDVDVNLCPPHRPDLNAFVERYHRAYKEECLDVHRPENLAQTCDITEDYLWHYNHERPHQGISCGNRPPYQAFPSLPLRPGLPQAVDPDHWLNAIDGKAYRRTVNASGHIKVNKQQYYVQKALAGQTVVAQVDAKQQQFLILVGRKPSTPLKTLPIKGLHRCTLEFEDYLKLICEEAKRER